MDSTTTKEKILSKIRDALISKMENPFKDIDLNSSVFHSFEDDKDVVFAQQFIDKGGNFIYCENEKAFIENLLTIKEDRNWEQFFVSDEVLKNLFDSQGVEYDSDEEKFVDLKIGITRCEFLVSRFGSIMVSSALDSGRRLFVYPEVHIVLAYTSQVVPDLKDALKGMRKKYPESFPSQVTVITGPSRTADIEKTLVMGAHGPRELFLFLIDND